MSDAHDAERAEVVRDYRDRYGTDRMVRYFRIVDSQTGRVIREGGDGAPRGSRYWPDAPRRRNSS